MNYNDLRKKYGLTDDGQKNGGTKSSSRRVSYDDLRKKYGIAEESKKNGGTKSSGQRVSYADLQKKYNISYDDVDSKYVSDFFNQANSFINSAQSDYDSTRKGTAASVYSTRNSAWQDLSNRSTRIRGWLNQNRKNMDQQTYQDMQDSLNQFSRNSDSVLQMFRNLSDYASEQDTTNDKWNSKKWQQKYGGVSYDYAKKQIDSESIAQDEREWLTHYTRTNDDFLDSMTADEIEQAIRDNESDYSKQQEVLKDLRRQIIGMSQTDVFGKRKQIQDQIDAVESQLDRIDTRRQNLDWAKTRAQRRATIAEWDANRENADFASGSAAGAAMENPSTRDLQTYEADLQRATNSGDSTRAQELISNPLNIENKLEFFLQNKDYGGDYVGSETGTWEDLIHQGYLKNWDQLKPEEVELYNYILYNQGQDAAQKYLDDMQMYLDKRVADAASKRYNQAYSEANALEKIAFNIASVPASVYGGAISFAGDTLNKTVGIGYNPYDPSHSLSNYSSQVRGLTGDEINRAAGGGFWGNIASNTYQGLMSGADSLLRAATVHGVGKINIGNAELSGSDYLMFMGAAAEKAQELYESGASDQQIALGALTAGAIETLFEHWSLEKFTENFVNQSPESISMWIKQTLAQMGTEGSEELFTEIANMAADAILYGANADKSKLVNELKLKGMTDSEATWAAVLQGAEEAWWAFYGGAVSGGAMGAGGGAYNLAINGINNRYYNQQGGQIVNSGGLSELVQNARNLPEGSADSRLMALANELAGVDETAYGPRTKSEQRSLSKKAGQLYKGVMKANASASENASRNTFQKMVRQQLEDKGIKNIDKAVDVITKAMYDGSLSVSESSMFESVDGKSVIDSVLNAKGEDGKSALSAETEYVSSRAKESAVDTYLLAHGAPAQTASEDTFRVSGNDETILRKSDGTSEAVNIAGISSASEGTLTLNLDDGSKVNANDISFASKGESLLYSAIAKMDISAESAENANWLISGAKDSGISMERYALGIQEAYRYGRIGVPYNQISDRGFAVGLTDAQRKTAYNLGAMAFVTEAQVKSEQNVSRKVTRNEKGKVIYDGVNLKGKTLNDQQKAGVQLAQFLASTGLNVHVYESVKGENGKFTSEHGSANGLYSDANGDIYIDLNAGVSGQGAMAYTISHEFTHFIEDWSSVKFREFSEALFAELGKSQVDVDAMVASTLERLQSMSEYRDMSDTELLKLAKSEVVAESCETLLTDTDALQRLAGKIKASNKSLWNRIKNFFKDLADRLRKAYDGLSPDSGIANQVKDTIRNVERLRDLWASAGAEAIQNYNAAAEVVSASEKNRSGQLFSERSRNTNFEKDKYFERLIDKFEALKVGSYVTVGVIKRGSPINAVGIPDGNLYFDVSKISQEMSTRTDPIPKNVMKQIPSVLDNPIVITEYKDKIGNVSVNVYGELFIGSSPVVVGVMIGKHRNGLSVDKVQTVHPNRNVLSEVTAENTLYLNDNKKETNTWFQALGAQMPLLGGIKYGLIRTISRSRTSVNMKSNRDSSEYKLTAEQENAEKRFGTTTDFNEAGYILPDGKMLRFTDDGNSGARSYDHRAIGMVYGVNVDLTKNHGFNTESNRHMDRFVEEGGIRFDPGDLDYDMGAGMQLSERKPLTKAQEQTIRDFIAWKKDRDAAYAPEDDFATYFGASEPVPLTIEFGGGSDISVDARPRDLAAWNVDHLTYEGGQINADRVISDIRHYYETGEIRKPSEVAKFRYSERVTDKDTLDFLDKQKTIKTYKTMQLIDGKLYPPMAARTNGQYEDYSILGQWEQATEHPELIRDGKYKLDKGKGQGSLTAAYNPYMHSSNLVLNDQFSGAYARPNLVTVECEVPASELTSGYHAEGAKDAVGWHAWHTGTVAGQLRAATGTERQVFLSRWIKPVRILADSEVAQMYKQLLSGTGISVPDNVVTPSLLTELRKAGVDIKESGRIAKYSERDYSYEALTEKPDMEVTTVGGNVPGNRADVVAEAKKNASRIGRYDTKTGSVSVYVDDIGKEVILGTNGLKHGLRRSKDMASDINSAITLNAGEIIKKSIRINELVPENDNAGGTYVLIGTAQNQNGELYIVRSVVNQYNSNLASMDVLYAIKAKKWNRLRSMRPGFQGPVTDSTISIANLLDLVNEYFPDILPESVLRHYGYDRRPEGDLGKDALYSDRNDGGMSNRQLLANALESTVQNEIEAKRLSEYKDNIQKISELQTHLGELKGEIKELSFAKGKRDTAKIKALQDEATKTANRITNMDKRLLGLEANQALKNVLIREREKAKKTAEAKGKEALAQYRESAVKAQKELAQRYQESRKKAVDSRARTAGRHKVQHIVQELNQYLLNGTKERHVPIELQKAVAEALNAVNMDTVGAEERIARLQQELANAKTPERIAEISQKISNIQQMGDRMDGKLQKLHDAYAEFANSSDPDVANAYDEVIAKSIDSVVREVGSTPLRSMTAEQLDMVYDMYKAVLHRVREASQTFAENKKQAISEIASRVMTELGSRQKVWLTSPLGRKANEFFWNNEKPIYAFERIGSNALTQLYEGVRHGEDTWALDITDARRFYLEQNKAHGADGWNFDQTYTFTSSSGTDFDLTLGQIMSLYAFSKRPQAADHIRKGGIVLDENTEVVRKGRFGIKHKLNLNDATTYNISDSTLQDIVGKLTPDQKSYVDAMQSYLSDTMGAKGNEVALKMYGIKLFKEKNYFPLKSARQYMEAVREQSDGTAKIRNKGFTKSTVEHASNPIILSSFNDVWANHVNDMSMYHSFVLPMEDFYRVYNYKTAATEESAPKSVQAYLENSNGQNARRYVDQLLKDLNGGLRADPRETVSRALTSKFKKAAVFASASVVIQQPSAVGRAFSIIDPKYFVGRKLTEKKHSALWEECKRYAPVAIIKEMGYFDTNMGLSTVDYLTSKEYGSLKEKAKGFFTDSDYRDEVIGFAPSFADEVTWVGIWEACKREAASKYNLSGEEMLKKAGERFTEVITKTQVYDSVFSRSSNMRAKSGLMNMVTSFMAEPTTSINMLENAARQWSRGYKRAAAKTVASVMTSVVFNSILVSFVYAARDDDEEKTYLEKFVSSFTGEMLGGINPLTYIPYLQDFWNMLLGYSVERADLTLIQGAIDGVSKFSSYLQKDTSDMDDEEMQEYYKGLTEQSWKMVDGFCSLLGIPEKNIRRDVVAIINMMQKSNWVGSSAASIFDAVKDGISGSIPKPLRSSGESNADKLYRAIMDGDTVYAERLRNSYGSEKSISTAIRKALRENDPRIQKAAQAQVNGDPSERIRISKEIISDGFSMDDVIAAVNTEINAITIHGESTTKVKGFGSADDFAQEIANGDQTAAQDIKDDIIQTAQKNGKTEDEANDSFVSSARSSLKESYMDEKITKEQAVDAMTTYLGYDTEKARDAVSGWTFQMDWGFTYSEAKDSYLNGEITSQQIQQILVSDGGMSTEDARYQVQAYDWEKQGYEDATVAAIREYNENCASYNVPKDIYLHIRSFSNNTKNDVDANGKTVNFSAMKKVMAEINSQRLTSEQKTAIARSLGWAEKNIQKYKPW